MDMVGALGLLGLAVLFVIVFWSILRQIHKKVRD